MNISVFIYTNFDTLISSTGSMLFYDSLSEGIFLVCFKTAKRPILKSGYSNSTMNYRPIFYQKCLRHYYQNV